ncbi:hypothetical protein MO867_08945 [Microbulbifer sp. OS29]|uniref:Uncharacterized protein n=1 Tax=Microbulbifer okhotskensis TaxID=2926617 RepID=A0A9X2EMJ4_9GAMM|nr:hypothetical protein [Microbulbifer okhotskensis]MCO1334466.1 hypothetical protein [Microbulbifer okhotskensis]
MDSFREYRLDDGRAVVVRSGHLLVRDIQTGIGPLVVKVPKGRSKDGKPVTFRSALVPPYVRKAWTLEDALTILAGPEAKGSSASNVSRLKVSGSKNTRHGGSGG